MASITKTGCIVSTGYPNPNLFRVSALTAIERAPFSFVANSSTDWTQPLRYYNGSASNHTFSGDTDTVLLNAASNLGIAFQRKATDINLDSSAYYIISCEAKATSTSTKLAIGLSYYTTANAWVWRGGTNAVAFTTANVWQKFTLKFKPDANTQYIMYCFTAAGTSGGTGTFTIRHCKLEKGEIATAWVPCVDDIISSRTPGFVEVVGEVDNIAKIQKNGYIQASEFIER